MVYLNILIRLMLACLSVGIPKNVGRVLQPHQFQYFRFQQSFLVGAHQLESGVALKLSTQQW